MIVISECDNGIYGDRVYYTWDLVEWAKKHAPGKWGSYDKRLTLNDGTELYGFEYGKGGVDSVFYELYTRVQVFFDSDIIDRISSTW